MGSSSGLQQRLEDALEETQLLVLELECTQWQSNTSLIGSPTHILHVQVPPTVWHAQALTLSKKS